MRLLALLVLACWLLVGAEEWWRVKPLPLDAFDTIRDDSLLLKRSELDDSSIHSCYEYRLYEGPEEVDWVGNRKKGKTEAVLLASGAFCYPAIVITGVRKCSTSALYALFESFPPAVTNKIKENCAFIGSRSLLQYFESLPSSVDVGTYIVDGCVDLKGNLLMRQILRDPQTFYIVLTRNFADWLWSAYNYWCNPSFDEYCGPGNWALPGVNIRSAQAFHDIVQGAVNGTVVPSPFLFNNSCDKGRNMFRPFVTQLDNLVPKEASVVMASEELEVAPVDIWRKISSMAGVPASHPGLRSFQDFRYNTQLQKERGADVKIEIDKYRPGVYEISNYEEISNASRQLLDKCWFEDCLWTSGVTRFQYSACGGDNRVLPSPVSKDDTSLNLHQGVLSGSNATNLGGYLNSNLRKCALDISAVLSKYQLLNRDSFGTFEPMFIISTFSSYTSIVLKLLHFSLGVDFSIHLSSNQQVDNSLCNSVKVIGLDPSMIEVVGGTDGSAPRVVIKPGFPCAGVQASRVALVVTDPLSLMWHDYQAELGYKQGLNLEGLYNMNWTAWDVDVFNRFPIYLNMTFSPVQDQIISVFPAENVIIAPIDNFVGKDRAMQLQTIIQLIVANFNSCKTCTDKLSFREHVLQTFKPELAMCGRIVLSSTSLQSDVSIGKKHFDVAYASKLSMCQLKEQFKSSKAVAVIPTFSASNTSCDKIRTEADRNSVCKLRFSKKRFLKTIIKPPVVLLAFGEAAINARLLIEHSTGILTGAANTNYSLMSLFHGEFACGQRMSVIHAHTKIVTPLFTKSKSSSISLNSWGKKKCMRGMLRGFIRGMLMLKDPMIAIFENCTSVLKSSSSMEKLAYERDSDVGKCLLYAARNFRQDWLDDYGQIALLEQFFSLKRNDILFVSHESLIASPRKLDVLNSMLAFANYGNEDQQRVECAFSFIDTRYHVSKINYALNFYSSLKKEFLCELLANNIAFSQIKFTFLHLFEGYQC